MVGRSCLKTQAYAQEQSIRAIKRWAEVRSCCLKTQDKSIRAKQKEMGVGEEELCQNTSISIRAKHKSNEEMGVGERVESARHG